MGESRARLWFGLTALVVLFGVAVQVAVAAHVKTGFFHTPTTRALNVFAFFTVQSNIIVGVTSLMLAMKPDRSSTAFNAFRLTGVLAIVLTGIVYHSVLSGLFDLESWALVADHVLHTAVPILAVLGWLLYGPRSRTSSQIAKLTLVFPVLWFVFTLIRGAIVKFYPYPFINVGKIGYARALINCVWVAILYLGLAYGATALDRRLAKTKSVGSP